MRYLLLLLPAALLAGPARYARLGDFEGQVEVQLSATDAWIAATRNLPLPEGAWLRTGAASKVEVELDEGSAIRIGPDSQFEISDYTRLATGQRVTMVAVDRGVAYLSGQAEGRDTLTVAVPGAQIAMTHAARIRLQVEEEWSGIAVLEGAVRFSSPAAELDLRERQTTRVEPANPARFFLYRDVTPKELDGWSEERDKALGSSTSAAHVVQRFGLTDLDPAGQWILTSDMGPIWKPKVADDWVPFRSGRWLWYDGLGYTWISDEQWGWLPYHYGRWTRLSNLGWIWAPARNGVFKPGEVYWLRGEGFVGWGPLGPGEQWSPADRVNPMPQEFVQANTTYAAEPAPGAAIDPAGFTKRPKDPLAAAEFVAALDSPPFPAAKLDQARPLVTGARLRVIPEVEGTRIEITPAEPPPLPAAAPIVVITEPAPPADPELVGVPVLVPVPAGIVFVTLPPANGKAPAITTAATRAGVPPGPAPHDPGKRPVPLAPAKKFRSAGEAGLYNTVVQDLETRNYEKSLLDLETWTQRQHETDYAEERRYYYMLAHNGLNQPAKVLESGAPLFAGEGSAAFADPMQALSAAYVAASNIQKLARLTRAQEATARAAGRELLAMLPKCFTAENKPRETSAEVWAKARADLEGLAKETINRAGR